MDNERFLSLVCFRIRGSNEVNERLVERLKARNMFLITSAVDGKTFVRLAVGAPATGEKHVNDAWIAVKEITDELLAAPAAV